MGVLYTFGNQNGFYSPASLVLLAITVLTPYFFFIPKSCLAAVIICAVIFMVEVHLVKLVWKSKSKYFKKHFFCCLMRAVWCVNCVISRLSYWTQKLIWFHLELRSSFASLLDLSKEFWSARLSIWGCCYIALPDQESGSTKFKY